MVKIKIHDLYLSQGQTGSNLFFKGLHVFLLRIKTILFVEQTEII